jgi:hypothetical protein
MSNQVNLSGIVISDDDFLAKDQTIPSNTTADGNGGSFDIGNSQEGSFEIVAKVGSVPLAITDTKIFTIALHDSADNSSFTALATIYTITAAGGNGAKAVGTILGKLVIPSSVRRYVKAVLTTNNADTGKVSVFFTLLPR